MNRQILKVIILCGIMVNHILLLSQNEPFVLNFTYDFIKFEFHHSLRIPNNSVIIKIENRVNGNDNSISVTVNSKPMQGKEKGWEHTITNKKYNISASEYNNLLSLILKINPSDIYHGLGSDGLAMDGTSCSIQYGSNLNSVKYSVWSPDSNTTERKLEQVLVCCIELLKIGGFKSSEIL